MHDRILGTNRDNYGRTEFKGDSSVFDQCIRYHEREIYYFLKSGSAETQHYSKAQSGMASANRALPRNRKVNPFCTFLNAFDRCRRLSVVFV